MDVLIFYVLFIWILISGLMRFRDVSVKGLASNFVQTSEKA
jgi:hypothetical protein